MKITKLATLLLLIVVMLITNGVAQDLPTGAIAEIDIGEGPVNAIAYSRSANRLAVAATNNIHIYDASTYTKLRVLAGHTDPVLALAFSPNGELLVSGGSDKTVRLWNVETGKLRRTREEHTAPVSTVAFSVDGKKFWSGSSKDDTIRSWYSRDGGRWSSRISPRTDVALIAIACSHKDETVAKTFNRIPSVCIIERSGHHPYTVSGHTDPVTVLTLYTDGRTLATGSADKTIQLWRLRNEVYIDEPLHTLTGHTLGITAMDFSANGKLLASGSSEKTVRLWDVGTGQHLHTLTGHTDEINAVAFLGDKALATGSSDGTVLIWDLDKINLTD